jgi:hypothetical protein
MQREIGSISVPSPKKRKRNDGIRDNEAFNEPFGLKTALLRLSHHATTERWASAPGCRWAAFGVSSTAERRLAEVRYPPIPAIARRRPERLNSAHPKTVLQSTPRPTVRWTGTRGRDTWSLVAG